MGRLNGRTSSSLTGFPPAPRIGQMPRIFPAGADRGDFYGPDGVLHSYVNFTDDEARTIVDETHRLGRTAWLE